MPQTLRPAELTPARTHLEEIDALRLSIGWGPGSWFLGPLMESGGCILGIRDGGGTLIAMGGAAVFPPAGFICNMVVHPDHKRRGLGRRVFEALLQRLEAAGYHQVQLEATEEGRPLYEQYGFRVRWESVGSILARPPEPPTARGLDALGPDDCEAVAALDQRATGMERGGLLRLLSARPSYREGLVARANGEVTGYGLRFDNRIGPLIATSSETAEQLARALASRSEPGTLATVGHPSHKALWEKLGFEVEPFDVRMVRGADPAGDPAKVVCMLNGGAG